MLLAGVVLALAARAVTGSDTLGIAALVATWLSCWRLFIPARYEMGPDGVLCRVAGRERRIGWPTIGHYEFHPRGVLFYPRTTTGRLTALRGFYVPWSDRGTDVQAIVRYYLGRPRGEAATTIEQASDA